MITIPIEFIDGFIIGKRGAKQAGSKMFGYVIGFHFIRFYFVGLNLFIDLINVFKE